MTENTTNIKARDAIQRKSIRNSRNRTCQTHRRETLISLKKVIIKARDTLIRRAIVWVPYQIMCEVNGEVADESV